MITLVVEPIRDELLEKDLLELPIEPDRRATQLNELIDKISLDFGAQTIAAWLLGARQSEFPVVVAAVNEMVAEMAAKANELSNSTTTDMGAAVIAYLEAAERATQVAALMTSLVSELEHMGVRVALNSPSNFAASFDGTNLPLAAEVGYQIGAAMMFRKQCHNFRTRKEGGQTVIEVFL